MRDALFAYVSGMAMPLQFASLFAVTHPVLLGAAKATTTKSSGSSVFFFIILFIALGAYLWIRPQRRKMRQQQEVQRQFEVGDEVVTTSGIVGRTRAFNGDRVELEIAPGTTIEIMRQAVARRIEPPVSDIGGEEATGDQGGDSAKWWPKDHDGDQSADDAAPEGTK